MLFRDNFSPLANQKRDSGPRGIWDAHRQLDRLFEELVGSTFSRGSENEMASFSPTYDVSETDDHYVITFDMPGVSKDDLKVEVRNNVLYVSGERKNRWKEEGQGRGSSRSTFQTALTLPSGVNQEDIEAQHQDGVLSIAIPREEAAKPRRIEIGDDSKSSFWSKILPTGEKKSIGERKGERSNRVDVQDPNADA
jgi:HSP20 family protein